MNKQLTKLFETAGKNELLVLGLMSGTSLDGLDLALCKVMPGHSVETLEFTTIAYKPELRERILSVQSQEMTPALELTRLHSELAAVYAKNIKSCLQNWNIKADEIDLIGSHGQTVYHAPSDRDGVPHATFQIVDGDHIAMETGIITVSDFRQKHTAAGGEGAPLAAIFDREIFSHPDTNRLLINLGGIANLTWIPSESDGGELISGDTGPANTLINEAMRKYYDRPFDENGEVAASGTVHSELVRYILLEPFFRKPLPKTTGQEEFKLTYVEEIMQGHRIDIPPADLIASLTTLTAQSIARMVEPLCGDAGYEVFVSGGGVHNPVLIDDLKKRLSGGRFCTTDEKGFTADSKEAAMMAWFAADLVAGEGFAIPGVTDKKIQLGKISLP